MSHNPSREKQSTGWLKRASSILQHTHADVASAAGLDAVEAFLGGRPSRGVRVHAVINQLAQLLQTLQQAELLNQPGEASSAAVTARVPAAQESVAAGQAT